MKSLWGKLPHPLLLSFLLLLSPLQGPCCVILHSNFTTAFFYPAPMWIFSFLKKRFSSNENSLSLENGLGRCIRQRRHGQEPMRKASSRATKHIYKMLTFKRARWKEKIWCGTFKEFPLPSFKVAFSHHQLYIYMLVSWKKATKRLGRSYFIFLFHWTPPSVLYS